MTSESWPPLPYDAWKDTYATLHMWTQVVGKVALALAPPLNHSWGVAFHLTARAAFPFGIALRADGKRAAASSRSSPAVSSTRAILPARSGRRRWRPTRTASFRSAPGAASPLSRGPSR